MGDQDGIWTQQGPGRAAKVGLVALAIAGVGLAGGIVLMSRSGRHSPKARPSIPPATLSPAVLPIGVVEYEAGTVARVATVNSEGNATKCFDGSPDLELLDVNARTIVYADRFSIFAVPLDRCTGKPTRLISARKPPASSPYQSPQPWCAALSPDGQRVLASANGVVAGFFVSAVDGSALRHVASPYGPCRWIDARHGLVDEADVSFAIDVTSGRDELLASPLSWSGLNSPDGSRAIFEGSDGTYMIDRGTGSIRRLAVKGGPAFIEEGSAWDSQGIRFITTEDSTQPVVINEPGLKPIDHIEVPAPYDSFNGVGWFDDGTLWFDGGDSISIVSIASQFSRDLYLPGVKQIRNSNYGTIIRKILILSERPGVLEQEPSIMEASAAPRDGIPSLGIGFQRPPNWSVRACRKCAAGGLSFPWKITDPNGTGDPSVRLTVSSESTSTIEGEIIRSFGAHKTCSPTQSCSVFLVDRLVIGKSRLSRLKIIPDEGPAWWFDLKPLGSKTAIVLESQDVQSTVLLELFLGTLRAV
jgi:hypothetical protein